VADHFETRCTACAATVELGVDRVIALRLDDRIEILRDPLQPDQMAHLGMTAWRATREHRWLDGQRMICRSCNAITTRFAANASATGMGCIANILAVIAILVLVANPAKIPALIACQLLFTLAIGAWIFHRRRIIAGRDTTLPNPQKCPDCGGVLVAIGVADPCDCRVCGSKATVRMHRTTTPAVGTAITPSTMALATPVQEPPALPGVIAPPNGPNANPHRTPHRNPIPDHGRGSRLPPPHRPVGRELSPWSGSARMGAVHHGIHTTPDPLVQHCLRRAAHAGEPS